MKSIAPLLAIALLALPVCAAPASKPNPNPHRAALKAARPAELPAQAAAIVAGAAVEARPQTAHAVVLAVDDIRPASVISVVGAISKSTPAAAAMAAAAGSARQPDLARFIARSAAIAASDQVSEIVEAVVREVPGTAHETVITVSSAVPDSSQAAIDGLRKGSPGWVPFLDQATANLPDGSANTPTPANRNRDDPVEAHTAAGSAGSPLHIIPGEPHYRSRTTASTCGGDGNGTTVSRSRSRRNDVSNARSAIPIP